MSPNKPTGNTDKFSEGKLCLTPDCGEPAKWKGLCPDCYGGAKTLIEAGETTWEKLQLLGLCAVRGTRFINAYNLKKKDTTDGNEEGKAS